MTDLAKIVELAQQIVELATPAPEPPDRPVPTGHAFTLLQFGMVNTIELVAAAEAVGVPLWIAAAFVEKESGGRNIYGSDVGGTFAGAGAVTEENYREFYRLVVEEKKTSNGVGPMQITYPAYFPQAATEGLKLWLPTDNFVFGLRIIKANLKGDYSPESIQRTGTLYNKGNLNDGINPYGYDVAFKAAKWALRLGIDLPDPEPEPAHAPDPEPKIGDTLREGHTGPAVTEAQKRLTAHGFPEPRDGVPNGLFGSRMTTQTKAFQVARSLGSDGVIGEKTWGALKVKSDSEMRLETIAILITNGWRGAPSTTQMVKDFQAAWSFGSALEVDGVVGPATYAAVLELKKNGGKLSPNFTALEMQCRCGDKYDDCRRVFVKRSLILALEKLRTKHYPEGLKVVSGARCEQHNASLQNAYSRSQHRYGRGCDIEPKLTSAQVKVLGVFSGIGYNRISEKVVHVDVRSDPGPDRDNYPAGSTTSPRIFPE